MNCLKNNKILVLFGVIILVAVAFLFVHLQQEKAEGKSVVPASTLQTPLPDISLQDLTGNAVRKADLVTGTPMVVNFFASWCVPCRAEHPLLFRLREEAGVDVIGVNYHDKPDRRDAFLTEAGNPYSRVLVEQDGSAAIAFGVKGLPETFVVDGAGDIRYHLQGPLTEDKLEQEVLPLLKSLQE